MKRILVGSMLVLLVLIAAWPLTAQEDDAQEPAQETVSSPPEALPEQKDHLPDPSVDLNERWCWYGDWFGPCKELDGGPGIVCHDVDYSAESFCETPELVCYDVDYPGEGPPMENRSFCGNEPIKPTPLPTPKGVVICPPGYPIPRDYPPDPPRADCWDIDDPTKTPLDPADW